LVSVGRRSTRRQCPSFQLSTGIGGKIRRQTKDSYFVLYAHTTHYGAEDDVLTPSNKSPSPTVFCNKGGTGEKQSLSEVHAVTVIASV
jgi:hypothetical protein